MATPPELISDATAEIFLLLPPDEPAQLVRAALVCRSWRQILTDPAFLRRYRAFHRAPPLLGFVDNLVTRDSGNVARFFPTTEAASPFPRRAFDCTNWWALDCRHGRVLLGLFAERVNLVVWDPVTGDHRGLSDPGVPPGYYTAAVLCAVRSCDHLDCHGGPFRVVLAGLDYFPGTAVRARHYSSEAGWNASAHLDTDLIVPVMKKPSALIGDDIYFQLMEDDVILRYDMERNRLSTIDPPAAHANEGGIIVMPMEDGSLGCAGVRGSTLCLWSTNVNPEGIAGWVRCGDIELMTRIPFMPYSEAHVIGSAEGLGIIFVATEVGLFMIELKSGQERKVGDPGNYFAIFPFMSFYTPVGTWHLLRIAYTGKPCSMNSTQPWFTINCTYPSRDSHSSFPPAVIVFSHCALSPSNQIFPAPAGEMKGESSVAAHDLVGYQTSAATMS